MSLIVCESAETVMTAGARPAGCEGSKIEKVPLAVMSCDTAAAVWFALRLLPACVIESATVTRRRGGPQPHTGTGAECCMTISDARMDGSLRARLVDIGGCGTAAAVSTAGRATAAVVSTRNMAPLHPAVPPQQRGRRRRPGRSNGRGAGGGYQTARTGRTGAAMLRCLSSPNGRNMRLMRKQRTRTAHAWQENTEHSYMYGTHPHTNLTHGRLEALFY
eukprot:SAG25_NODE_3651_length_1012_cov_0.836802_1_plen_219_part_00